MRQRGLLLQSADVSVTITVAVVFAVAVAVAVLEAAQVAAPSDKGFVCRAVHGRCQGAAD